MWTIRKEVLPTHSLVLMNLPPPPPLFNPFKKKTQKPDMYTWKVTSLPKYAETICLNICRFTDKTQDHQIQY